MTKEPLNIQKMLEEVYPHTCKDKIAEMEQKFSMTTDCLCPPDIKRKREALKTSLRQAMEAISPQYDKVSSDELINYGYQKAKEEIKQKTTKRIYWLPRFICSVFYHRFGYKDDHCVRCGTHLSKADGMIISNDYD